MESILIRYVPYRSYKKIFSPISVIELLKEKGEKRRYRNLTEYLKVDAVVTYMLRNLPCLGHYHLAYLPSFG